MWLSYVRDKRDNNLGDRQCAMPGVQRSWQQLFLLLLLLCAGLLLRSEHILRMHRERLISRQSCMST